MAKLTLIMGGVCAGKTTLRRKEYKEGYVNIDASDIFLDLCGEEFLDFPSIHEDKMEEIGGKMAIDALQNKNDIAIEIIGDNEDILLKLIKKIEVLDYKVNLVGVTCSLEEAIERNENRDNDDVSAHYTQDYHIKWLLNAIEDVKN